jgi:hypothetical protein
MKPLLCTQRSSVCEMQKERVQKNLQAGADKAKPVAVRGIGWAAGRVTIVTSAVGQGSSFKIIQYFGGGTWECEGEGKCE